MWTINAGETDAVQVWRLISRADNLDDSQLIQENLDMVAPNETVIGLIAGE